MKLHEIAIKHPVFATMLSAVLVLFGLVGFERIGVDRLPDVEFPVISVRTIVPGADPLTVSTSVTTILEEVINSVPGIDFVQSTSSPGSSLILTYFDLEKNIDVAFNEVQSKVNQVLRDLPPDAEPPVVGKLELGSQPILWLVLRGDRTLQELNEYAANTIKKRLETIDGVGEIELGGERRRTIRVELDTMRMAALDVTTQDVLGALEVEHVQIPGGYVVGIEQENLLELDLEFHDLVTLENMVVRHKGNTTILLKDVAIVEDGLEDFRQYARFNGEEAVGLGVVKVSGANTVAIVDEVKRRLATEIVPALPPGLILEISSDEASIIEEIITALKEHLVMGTLLAALVVFLFLKEMRSTLIIATAIPVSLLGAVLAMYLLGYTFNVLTLLSLLLLIGIVVDDAIVVLENVYRHQEKLGETPHDAAIKGTNEVIFAVIASTLALVAIFVPVIFLGGIIGRFFEAFAVVVVCGVVISSFVSLTLTPMLCARYLRTTDKPTRLANVLEKGFSGMERAYRGLIEWALRFRWTVILISLLIVFASGLIMGNLGGEFMPEQDEGRLLINFKTPLGSSIEYTIERLDEIEAVLNRHPEIDNYFSTIGSGANGRVYEGMISVTLTPHDARQVRQQDLENILREELNVLAGVRAFPAEVPVVGGQRGEPLQFALKGPNLYEVARLSQLMYERMQAMPEMGAIDIDLDLELPQYTLKLDRIRARSLGITTKDAAEALAILAGGLDVAKYNEYEGDATRYDVRVSARTGEFSQATDLSRVYLRGQTGQLVRLDTIAELEPSLGPATVNQIDLQYGANFFITPTVALDESIVLARELADDMLPLGYSIQLLGSADEFEKTVSYVRFALLMAVLLIFMVLASQFNSYVQPLMVMLAQPLAIIGALFALWIGSHTLNIYSMIGMILLMGLVAKNSILMIDLTNQLREKGRGVNEALLEACPLRMRPVLMTSFTVIFAMLPAALGRGAGADTNAPLSVAVIGGMVSSTFLTLVVIPAVYSLVENFRERLRQRKAEKKAQTSAIEN